MATTYYSPSGNPEIWNEKPDGYFTPEEWKILNPPPEPLPPTLEETQAHFSSVLQGYLDSFVKTRNYDNILSAASYATSTNPQFRMEGQYAVEIRDAVWAKGYEILGAVLSGQREMPSLGAVLSELPALQWPDTIVTL